MTNTSPEVLYRVTFLNELRMQAQQKMAKFEQFANQRSEGGSLIYMDSMNSFEFERVRARFQPKGISEPEFVRRAMVLESWKKELIVSKSDVIRGAPEPIQAYAAGMNAARNRLFDNTFVRGFMDDILIYDTNQQGMAAIGSTPFPAAQILLAEDVDPAGGGRCTDLVLNRMAARVMEDVDDDDPSMSFCLLGFSDVSALVEDTRQANQEFVTDRPVETGMLRTRYGLNFVRSKRLRQRTQAEGAPAADVTRRAILFGYKMHMQRNTVVEVDDEMIRRTDIVGNPWELNAVVHVAAGRWRDEGMYIVWCKSPGLN